ncbi:MAG: hypothetical protein GF411_03290 [Candidatus Lokiarchaeota archaeon]|nr:hypothetical protein [Candidatus Lokiarchaeota archaeon]
MTLCDTDKDGYREIIIGGTNDIRLNRPDGFVYIYECVGGTFQQAWSAPSEVTYWNPISVLELDDQDYDGEQEIIIGHTKGFDMWEHIPGTDSEYKKVEYVTASPNYPRISYDSSIYDGETYAYSGHYLKDMVKLTGSYDYVIWQVYENDNEIYLRGYNLNTESWIAGVPLVGTYVSHTSGTDVDYETRPTITAMSSDNDLYIAWEMTATNASHYIVIVSYDYASTTWSEPMYIQDITGFPWVRRNYPSVFEINNTHVGLTYIYDDILFTNKLGYMIIPRDLSSTYARSAQYNGYANFNIHDARATRLEDGSFAIAMSAINTELTKPDYDIWTVVVGNDLNFTGVNPHQATTSYYDEFYVDIEYLRSDEHALVISYENVGAPLEDRFAMTSSLDRGSTWGRPDYLNSIPNYIERFEDPTDNTVTYKKGGMFLSGPIAYGPAFVPLADGGFLYTGTFAYMIRFTQVFGPDVVTFHVPAGDLCYGINPQSDWVHNNLHDVIDLDVGDTDGDHRREVVVGFDHQVAAYEMKSSSDGTGIMSYDEVWLSNPFENPVTALTVYDSNGNGFEEIGIATERGDVFLYEFSTPAIGVSSLMTSEIDWITSTTPSTGNFGSYRDMMAFDIDQDGLDEMVFAAKNNNMTFCLDDDGSVLWNETPGASGYNNLYLSDITNDSIPEVFLAGIDDTIYILDVTDGSLIDDIISPSYSVYDIQVADIDQNGEKEILATTANGHFWLFHLNGSMYHHYTPTGLDLKFMEVGNFTGESTLMVAITDEDGHLWMINPLNGTEFYESPSNTVYFESQPKAYDFDNDGVDELAFGYQAVSIIDFEKNEIYYNSSTYSYVHTIEVADFDNDNNVEILAGTQLHGLVMVDAVELQVQWQYDSEFLLHWCYDFTVGDFGGNGNPDIALSFWNVSATPYLGAIVALDGRSGIPMWFNTTNDPVLSIVAANITGGTTHSVVGWEPQSDSIYAITGYERIFPTLPDAYTIHELYINQTVTDSYINDMWAHDLSKDGLDEVITYDDNDFLICWNATEGTVIWNKTYSSGIGDLKFGDVDGGGWDDIVLYTYDGIVEFIDGQTGNAYSSVTAETGFDVVGIAVGEFATGVGYDDHEVFILTRKSSSTYTVYGAWYSEDGLMDHDFSSNWTSPSMGIELAVGYISSSTTLDIICGSGSSGGRLYRGYDGQYLALFGTSAYGIAIGDINADTVDDIAIKNSVDTVSVYNGATYGFLYSKSFGVANLRGLWFADIHNNDGTEELVVNFVGVGVYAYDSTGTAVWYFDAPITVSSTSSWCQFADMDADGHTDLVFTNFEYLSVISGATGDLLWHYQHPYRVYKPIVGQFAKVGDALDVAAFSNTYFYVVSGRLTPRSVPVVLPIGSSSSGFMQVLGTSLALGIPLLVVATAGIYVYRRREEE